MSASWELDLRWGRREGLALECRREAKTERGGLEKEAGQAWASED